MADDINALLLAQKTARSTSDSGISGWVTGRKKGDWRAVVEPHTKRSDGDRRRRERLASLGQDGRDKRSRSEEIDVGMATPRQVARNEKQVTAAVATVPSASAACDTRTLLAQRLLDYVMQRELGGRHNAPRGDDLAPLPSRAALLFETATAAAAAAWNVTHVVEGFSRSEIHAEPVPEAVLRYRQSMYTCCYENDLVGGCSAMSSTASDPGDRPLPAHTRNHLFHIVELGLRGERPEARTTPGDLGIGQSRAGDQTPQTQNLVLFEDGGSSAAALEDLLEDTSSESPTDSDEE